MKKYRLKCLLSFLLVLSLTACTAPQKPAKIATVKPNIKRVPPKHAGDKPQLKTKFNQKALISKDKTTSKDKSRKDKFVVRDQAVLEEKQTNNHDSKLAWGWPAQGTILRRFTATNTSLKGIEIGGSEGTPVLSAGDGEVVYSGNSLRGYGNLIIIKHKKNFITAYAHNRINVVKEGDTVRLGQRIAEMGQTGTDRVKLHFEVRYQGKPLDPQRVLPPR